MLGTAGHVDHGKTAVVRLLTGCDTDTLTEEKQRGMTIDLGFAPCRLANDRIVGIVDVPGHVDFIRNMVAGAHGIDIVVLVVAADDGVMPQTREHLNILSLMGLKHGLVALTKIDLVESDRRAQATEDVRRLLEPTFLRNAPICPLSTVTGDGFEAFFDALNHAVDSCEDRPDSGLFRQWIEDVFVLHGTGTVVTGIPSRGKVRPGDHLQVVPTRSTSRVRRLQVYGEEAGEGRAGECVALNLTDVAHDSLRRGMVLCEPGAVAPCTMFEADLHLLDALDAKLKDGTEVHLHIGTASQMARLALLEQPQLGPGQHQFAQLRLEHPLGIVAGDRFVLRANDRSRSEGGLITIGGGRVVDTSNVRLRRRRPWTLAALDSRLKALDDPVALCATLLQQARQPLSPAALSQPCQLHLPEVELTLEQLHRQQLVRETPTHTWVHTENLADVARQVLESLDQFHRANPKQAGLEMDTLAAAIGVDRTLLDLALQDLVTARKIRLEGGILSLAGWQAQVSSDEELLGTRIAMALKEARWTPPTTAELAASLNQPPARIAALIKLLLDRGILIRVAPELCLHREAVEAARQVVLRLFAQKTMFTTMDFRDALGVSRKYAVPLLDYLDSTRFTVRSGNQRTPGVEARQRMSAAGAKGEI